MIDNFCYDVMLLLWLWLWLWAGQELVEVRDSYDCRITCPRLVLSLGDKSDIFPVCRHHYLQSTQIATLIAFFITQCTVIMSSKPASKICNKQKCWNERKDARNRKDSSKTKLSQLTPFCPVVIHKAYIFTPNQSFPMHWLGLFSTSNFSETSTWYKFVR